MSRSLWASGATSPPKQPSTALALAMWWLAGQTPQMRVTMRGSSSMGRPDHEALEAAQLGDLEEGVFDGSVIVEEDVDLAVALETGDGVDADLSRHRRWLLCRGEAATL